MDEISSDLYVFEYDFVWHLQQEFQVFMYGKLKC